MYVCMYVSVYIFRYLCKKHAGTVSSLLYCIYACTNLPAQCSMPRTVDLGLFQERNYDFYDGPRIVRKFCQCFFLYLFFFFSISFFLSFLHFSLSNASIYIYIYFFSFYFSCHQRKLRE